MKRASAIAGAWLAWMALALAALAAFTPPRASADEALGKASSGSPEERFRAAGSAYEAGRFAEAGEIYEGLLAEGFDDARVHYNLGNARFKMGKLGPAILSYERALDRDPSDADARENLAYADLLIADKVGAQEEEFPAHFLKLLARRFDPDRATLACALLCLFAGILAAPLWFQPSPVVRRALGSGAAIAASLAFVCGLMAVVELTLPRTDQAIVLAPSVDGRSSPAADGTVLFTVHEGLKVQIRGERPGWIHIGVPNGLAGWIESSQAERI
jgi:tetratricopeptide (TPR) repeat protein